MEWIDPIGGLGDSLIVSGVIFDVWTTTGQQFGLVRRPQYSSFYKGHPAITQIATPPIDAKRVKVDYWFIEPVGAGNSRPYQILARRFGLQTPRAEQLWIGVNDADYERSRLFPIEDGCIVLGPTSVSPRKQWPMDRWVELARRIQGASNRMLVQVGSQGDFKIPGTVSLCGLTSARDVGVIMKRAALAIVIDAFPLHAASWAGTPTVALWGPSEPDVFGYPWQTNLRSRTHCDALCYPTRGYDTYLAPCDHEQDRGHCMADIAVDQVWDAVQPLLAKT